MQPVSDALGASAGPYEHAAGAYWSAGWRGVLPLPAGQKKSPPRGYTGQDGAYPSWPDISAWLESADGRAGNIALRLPADVIGIDVDAYGSKQGAESLAKLEARLGALPATWISTARESAVSGIRFFRVQVGGGWKEKAAGPDIDLIRREHRYAVVWPSTNPNADGARYVWVAPNGERGVGIPGVEDLPELPAAWVEALSEGVGADRPQESTPAAASSADPFAAPSRAFTMSEAKDYLREPFEKYRALRDGVDSGWNQKLNDLACMVGHFVPGFWPEADMFGVLFEASRANGAVAYQGVEGITATIKSGMRRGMSEPYRFRDVEISAVAAIEAESVGRPPMKERVLTRQQLEDLPAPVPLIRDLLDLDSESWIIGAPGGFKSFVALDWACHIGLGKTWRGKAVRQGSVLYVAAEGKKGLKLRAKAWEETYGVDIENVMWLPEVVPAASPGLWAELVEVCRELEPVLVVLDTQARMTVGLEENSNSDMSKFVDAVSRLKSATGACVLVVHHTGRNGQDARGASALDGAQDTEIRVDRPAGREERLTMAATISTDKQKDGSEDVEFEVELLEVEVGVEEETGRKLTSLALRPFDPFGSRRLKPAPDWEENLTDNMSAVVVVLRELTDEKGATLAEVRRMVNEARAHLDRPSLHYSSVKKALTSLVARNVVDTVGSRFVLSEFLDHD